MISSNTIFTALMIYNFGSIFPGPIPHCKDFFKTFECWHCEQGFYTTTDGKCAPTDEHHCGKKGETDCLKSNTNWEKASCEDNKCKLVQCEAGFYNNGENHCLKQDEQHCGYNGKTNCLKHGTVTATCQNNQCVATSCSKGFHQENNNCIENSVSACPENGEVINCISTYRSQGWSQSKCTDNGCEAISCAEGYHYYNYQCEKDDAYNCGGHGKSCYSIEVASAECSLNNKAQTECKALKCNDNYYLDESSGTCLRQNVNHCGAENFDCTTLNGWGAGECRQGKCILHRCDRNHTVNNSWFGNNCTCDTEGIRDYFFKDKENNNCIYKHI